MLPALISGFVLLIASLGVFSQTIESRVIFDEDFNWLTPEAADTTLHRIKKAGFNVFVPVVWHGRGVSWPSKLAPKEPLWEKEKNSSADPLRYLIKRAHDLGIEVHPWFTITLRQREFLQEYYDDGTPTEAFNVHFPSFQKFIASVVEEVVRNYDVDGVNLDYIRSMDICVSNFCQQDYLQKQGRVLESDISVLEVSASAKRAVIAWNSDAIGSMVRNISLSVKKIKPKVLVSVDSLVGSEPWRLQGADSISWANRGWVDVVYHMEYSSLDRIDNGAIRNALRKILEPEKFVLLVGNYESSNDKSNVWPRDSKQVADLLNFARKVRPGNRKLALYEYRFLNDDQIARISKGPFAIPARSR